MAPPQQAATAPRLVSFGLGIWVLVWFEETFSRIGVFADREGTDLFRAQIHAAEQVKLAGSDWFGRGFNTAWVDVTSFRHMWFHDSYAALLVEGGIPMFAVMLLLVGGVALGLLSRRQTVRPELRAAEGAIIVLLVCPGSSERFSSRRSGSSSLARRCTSVSASRS